MKSNSCLRLEKQKTGPWYRHVFLRSLQYPDLAQSKADKPAETKHRMRPVPPKKPLPILIPIEFAHENLFTSHLGRSDF
jgi:hypothetical protein